LKYNNDTPICIIEMQTKFNRETSKEEKLEDLGIDEKVTLKSILEK